MAAPRGHKRAMLSLRGVFNLNTYKQQETLFSASI